MSRARIFALALLVLSACVASAKPPFLKVLTETYKISHNSELGKAKCLTCHEHPAPPRRNPYGLAVGEAMEKAHSRVLTAEILKSIEKKDSDGDGASNIAEIRAGTLPGDKNSKPAKAVHSKGKRHKAKKTAFVVDPGYGGFGVVLVSLGLVGTILPLKKRG